MVPASRKIAAFALLAASAGFVVAQHASAPVPVAIEKAEPKAQRSTEHRKVHRTAPKITKRKWEPLPKIKPIAPIMTEEKRAKPKAKQQGALPSCAVIRREYERMNQMQRAAAYLSATREQVAHGRRCLGM